MILEIALGIFLGLLLFFGTWGVHDWFKYDADLSEDTKINLGIAGAVFIVTLAVSGFVSFMVAYSTERGSYYSSNRCDKPDRLNTYNPFHKLGCWLAEVPEDK